MTEKIVNTGDAAPRPLHWRRFLPAFLVAPLLGSFPALAEPGVAFTAVLVGYPVYVLVGMPLLIWHLRRNPPAYLPILLLAAVAQLALIPIALLLGVFVDGLHIMAGLPWLMLFGLVFGLVWAALFTAIYRHLIRDLYPSI